ncbi:MAG: orotidine-5'-phosphate decarboxylase [Cellvibrionaceae bacterium]
MNNKKIGSRLIVACDFANTDDCLSFVKQLDPKDVRLKVGKELFAVGGPQLVKELVAQQFDVFLDLKYHDIPNTVAKAVAAAARLGVWMVNVHASGGSKMMVAAKKALEHFDKPPLLIGVTVLTSMSAEDLLELDIQKTPEEQVKLLAQLARDSGLDGVVCSAQEAATLKSLCGSDFLLVTPGIRLKGAETNDQQRVMTPVNAIQAGSDYLVMGRPITGSETPAQTCHEINESLQSN